MKEGFWGNYETGTWFKIDEHERWLRDPGNAERLRVPAVVAAEFAKYPTRDELLPFVYRHAPVMRWRCHGTSVTFEFDSPDWGYPLALICRWGRACAGDHLHFHMVNFRTMEVRDVLWQELKPAEDEPDDLCMVREQNALLERFKNSEGACLIAAPVWKGVPRVKLYKLAGLDRRGRRTELLFAENRNGSPGFAKAELDKSLASPYLFLSRRRPRIVREGETLVRPRDWEAALDAYLPQGFLSVVTRKEQAQRRVLDVLKKHLDRRKDREIDAAIRALECAVIPDRRMWRDEGDPERMSRMLDAKLLRLGYGLATLPGAGKLVVNCDDRPEFFAQIADLAAFAGAGTLFLKRRDRDELEKLDLADGGERTTGAGGFRGCWQSVDYARGRGALPADDPRRAAICALRLEFFRYLNIFGKMGCDLEAKRFDGLYRAATRRCAATP